MKIAFWSLARIIAVGFSGSDRTGLLAGRTNAILDDAGAGVVA